MPTPNPYPYKHPNKLHWRGTGSTRYVLCGTVMAYPLFAEKPQDVDCSRCLWKLRKEMGK